jgi:uncharacterized protein with HEPN domain
MIEPEILLFMNISVLMRAFIWDIVENDIPPLKQQIEFILYYD